MVQRPCILVLFALGIAVRAHAADRYLFAYFKDPGRSGVHFAIGDGYRFTLLNAGNAILAPAQDGELMRDPFITRGPDHEYHMVWTWGWRDTKIGYAHSRDMVHWSGQLEVPMMKDVPDTRNTWAPEIYWDKPKSQWLIIWSSTVGGNASDTVLDNRIYCSLTKDFRSFSKPAIFFDPGYNVIDATILETKRKFYLIFKDERPQPLKKFMKIADGPTVEGPWSNISDEFTESWTEGPSAIRVGNEYVVYFDRYRDPKGYEAAKSTDLKHWKSINDRIVFPAGAKHGSFLKLNVKEERRLKAAW